MLMNLKLLRTSHGISQKQLACEVGVSQQSINKYENHNIEPDIATLIRIADFFHTSVDYLIGHYEMPVREEFFQAIHLSQEESTLLRRYRCLGPKQRQSIELVMENYLEDKNR